MPARLPIAKAPIESATTGLLDMQFTLLRDEVNVVNSAIRQFDDITKSIKEWTVVGWTAAVGLSIKEPSLRPFIHLTALIPLLFWLVDTSYRRVQRRCIFRMRLISRFVTNDLSTAVAAGAIRDFPILDPLAAQSSSKDVRAFVSWLHVGTFTTVALLYLGLAVTSAVLWWIVN
jgi:hypothetical protein